MRNMNINKCIVSMTFDFSCIGTLNEQFTIKTIWKREATCI